MNLINLTPHPVTIFGENDEVLVTYAPAGPMARCAEERIPAGTLPVGTVCVPIAAVGFGEVSDLPEPEPGTIYIVSRATAERVAHREDVLYPDIPVRNDVGHIIGCRGLARVVPELCECQSPA